MAAVAAPHLTSPRPPPPPLTGLSPRPPRSCRRRRRGPARAGGGGSGAGRAQIAELSRRHLGSRAAPEPPSRLRARGGGRVAASPGPDLDPPGRAAAHPPAPPPPPPAPGLEPAAPALSGPPPPERPAGPGAAVGVFFAAAARAAPPDPLRGAAAAAGDGAQVTRSFGNLTEDAGLLPPRRGAGAEEPQIPAAPLAVLGARLSQGFSEMSATVSNLYLWQIKPPFEWSARLYLGMNCRF
ncbi:uncharacterized protein [Bos mutus]|uniref:uncharacterized protein n=1 Tax=Bos mutus TaxID=72004 RepID=UPI0038B51C3E